MRVCVTGGLGFIGSRLCPALHGRGDEVVIVDVRPAFGRVRAETIVADVRDGDAMARALRGADAVVHLAAVSSVVVAERDPEAAMSVNVGGTESVVRAAADQGVARLVVASSAAVYGDARHAVAESAPLRPLGVYGRSKALAEGVVAGAPSGLVSSTLRLFNVYGPGQADDPPAAVIPAAIRAARTGEEFPLRGDGGQRRDFVHVDDVVGAVIASLGAVSSATLNVGTGRGETVSAALDAVEACTGRSIRRVRSPLLPGEIESSVAIVDALRLSYPGLRFRPLRAGLRGMLSRETETLPAMTVH